MRKTERSPFSKGSVFINTYNCAADYRLQKVAADNLCEKFPFIRRAVIGRSLCGRDITALTLGQTRGCTLYAATFHGSEWLNTLFVLRFFEECCAAYKSGDEKIRGIIGKRGLSVIPCVNPDGVEIQLYGSASCERYKRLIDSITADTVHWQANARGVDLNHNFSAGWRALKKTERSLGITAPAATRYGGTQPFSEPETQALRRFCLKNCVSSAIAFHSQGREVYCTYGCTPEESFILGKTFADAAGYSLTVPEKAAVGGGFKDWVIGFLGKPAITVETGLGKNPLPLSDYPKEYERIKKAMLKCIYTE